MSRSRTLSSSFVSGVPMLVSTLALPCGVHRTGSADHRQPRGRTLRRGSSIAPWTCVSTISASSTQRWSRTRYSRRSQLRNRPCVSTNRIRTADGCSTDASTFQGAAGTDPDRFGWATASSWTSASACDPSRPSVRTFERSRGGISFVRSVSVWNPPWTPGLCWMKGGIAKASPSRHRSKRGRHTTLQTHPSTRRGRAREDR